MSKKLTVLFTLLLILFGCSSEQKNIYVKPEPAPIIEPPQKYVPKPITTEIPKSTTESKYLDGIISVDDILPNSALFMSIKGVDIQHFPDSVSLYLTIQDYYGNFIAALAPPYTKNQNYKNTFMPVVETILGDKKTENISEFDVLEYHEKDSEPISISLALDYSGSMERSIDNLQSAARNFINLWGKYSKDEISIIKYDDRVATIAPPTRNKTDVENRFKDDFFLWAGSTAMYDAAIEGINNLKQSDKPRVLILFTDGIENASFPTIVNDVLAAARKNNVKIYSIGFGETENDVDGWLLKEISDRTGGKYYFAKSGNEQNIIQQIFTDIFYSMKVYYKLTYVPIREYQNEPRTLIAGIKHPKDENKRLEATACYFPPKAKVDLPEPEREYVIALFDFNKDKLSPERSFYIDKFVAYLKDNPGFKMQITGHTDSKGSDKYNSNLGLNRARQTASYFEKKGIDKKRLIIKSKGKKELIHNPDDQEYLSRENRRVEVKFIK